jgi:hypothetical protein
MDVAIFAKINLKNKPKRTNYSEGGTFQRQITSKSRFLYPSVMKTSYLITNLRRSIKLQLSSNHSITL